MEMEKQKSEFNMAVATLQRMHNLLVLVSIASSSLDAHSWFHYLLPLYRELSPFMKKDKAEEYKEKIKSMLVEINDWNKKSTPYGSAAISSELYFKLHTFEMELREVMDDQDLLTRRGEDASKAFK